MRLCCEALLPKRVQVKLVPVPNEQAYGHSHGFEQVRLIVAESAKLCFYSLLLIFRKPRPWNELVAAT